MDTVGGPDAKKARWSPTSFNGANGLAANASASAGPTRDAFANYGYGPQAAAAAGQNGFNGSPPASNFAAANAALYSTPALSVNTAVAGGGMGQQMSPNTQGPYTPQNQQPPSANPNSANPYGGFGGYNVLGMGLPAMGVLGGFPYGGQMAATFATVSLGYLYALLVGLRTWMRMLGFSFCPSRSDPLGGFCGGIFLSGAVVSLLRISYFPFHPCPALASDSDDPFCPAGPLFQFCLAAGAS